MAGNSHVPESSADLTLAGTADLRGTSAVRLTDPDRAVLIAYGSRFKMLRGEASLRRTPGKVVRTDREGPRKGCSVVTVTSPPRLLVIVPALNEAAAITDVVQRIRRHVDADVLVVDDGSSDNTARLASAAGAIVVRHPFNLGVGAAIRTAMRFANEYSYDGVVQVDGDGQHDPADVRTLLDALSSGADIAVGNRFGTQYRISPLRRLVMRVLSRGVSLRLSARITDPTSGFRAFSARAVAHFAQHYPTDYLSDTVESLLLAADAGLMVVEVPVSMQPRTTGVASARTVKSIYYVTRILLIMALHRLRSPVLLTEDRAL